MTIVWLTTEADGQSSVWFNNSIDELLPIVRSEDAETLAGV